MQKESVPNANRGTLFCLLNPLHEFPAMIEGTATPQSVDLLSTIAAEDCVNVVRANPFSSVFSKCVVVEFVFLLFDAIALLFLLLLHLFPYRAIQLYRLRKQRAKLDVLWATRVESYRSISKPLTTLAGAACWSSLYHL